MENVLKKQKAIRVNNQFDSLLKKNKNKKNNYIYKFVFQIIFCIVILLSVWLYKIIDPLNYEYNKEKYGWILEYNMTYNGTYNYIVEMLNKNFQFNIPLKEIIKNEEVVKQTIPLEVIEENQNIIENENIQNDTAINENIDIINKILPKEIEAYNNMQIIAKEIKEKYKLGMPTTGKITCSFGNRQSDNEDISTFHLGIDIANAIGTNIKSAIDGEVIEVSKNSVYGNYIKIQTDDILTVYAHCNKTVVKKGEKVKVGDVIGQMGKTGLATGTHLHFEVRKNGIVINPEYLIDFTK